MFNNNIFPMGADIIQHKRSPPKVDHL